MTTPAARPCDACNARPGEPCAPDCIAVPSILAELEDDWNGPAAAPGSVEWLLQAAAKLDAKGDHALAAEARAEAVEMQQPKPEPRPVTVRCDDCRAVVTSSSRLDRFDRLGVDWVLCAKCEAR